MVRLDPADALLHQVPALHVEVEDAVLSLHLPGGDDLGEGVVEDGLVGDEVEEVDPVLVEGQDVLVGVVGRPPGVVALSPNLQQCWTSSHVLLPTLMEVVITYREEAGAEQRPL